MRKGWLLVSVKYVAAVSLGVGLALSSVGAAQADTGRESTVQGESRSVISACVSGATGQMYVRDSCRPGESKLKWNVQGPRGPRGKKGAKGLQGPAGLAGAQGATGPEGPQSAAGATGPTGPIGPQGQTGPTGATGPIGPQGPSGPTGVTGAVGATGPSNMVFAEGVSPAPKVLIPADLQGSEFFVNTVVSFYTDLSTECFLIANWDQGASTVLTRQMASGSQVVLQGYYDRETWPLNVVSFSVQCNASSNINWYTSSISAQAVGDLSGSHPSGP